MLGARLVLGGNIFISEYPIKHSSSMAAKQMPIATFVLSAQKANKARIALIT
jgi:hypothetical protein